MERINADDLRISLVSKPFITKKGIIFYKTKDNQIAKLFSPKILIERGKEIERKVSDPIDIEGVVLPKQIIVDDGKFVGYTMDSIEKRDKDTLTKESLDLTVLGERYLQLEKLVRNAGDDIVFPYLLENSVIIDKDGKVHISNYEDIQIGDEKSPEVPNILNGLTGRLFKYGSYNHYTKQLDMLSLTHYYLRSLYGGFVNTEAGALRFFGLDDEMIDRVTCADNDCIDNEYLGEKVMEIAEKYELTEIPISQEMSVRKLVLK